MALEGIPTVGGGYVPAGVGAVAFPNANRDATGDSTVPELIEETSDLVRGVLGEFRDLKDTALAEALDTIKALSDAKAPDDLPSPPTAPSIITTVNGAINLSIDSPPDLGAISQDNDGSTGPYTAPTVTIPDGDTLPSPPTLQDITVAPVPNETMPGAPVQPSIETNFPLPDAPARSYGAAPDLLTFNLPVFNPIALPLFGDTAPEFNVPPPDPFVNWTEPTYSSDVKDAIRQVLLTMLAGGTGLDPAVEDAIWQRGRAREDTTTDKAIEELIAQWAARGFAVPQGYLNGQVATLRDDRDLKVNALSRDIAIKQADLEQTNRNNALERGLTYEQVYTALFTQVVDRNFQIAKFVVESQINIYNARVTAFNVEQQVFAQKITLYRARIDGALAEIRVFEALVEAEKAKGQVNLAMVQTYEAKVRAYAAEVDGYRALIQGVQARVDVQKVKIDVYKAQVEAQVAGIQAVRTKYEAYSAQAQAATAAANVQESKVRLFVGQVQAAGQKQDLTIKRAEAQMQTNRLTLDFLVANMQRATSLHQIELARINANLSAFQATVQKAVAKSQLDRENLVFATQMQIEISRLAIAKYTASIEVWRTRAQQIISMAQINATSLQAAGQITATIFSGAAAGMHVNAGMSAGVSASEGHQVSSSNQTSQSKSEGISNQYQVVHSFQHRV